MINIMKEPADIREKLHATALDAPKTSGVYLWKDETGLVLYVGKAKSLKNRLSSYFTSNRDIKTRILVSRAHSIEYITTENEYEALLLENTFIKKLSPKYNINLKDGKTYPVIKVTPEAFPRIYRTRQIRNDGARYFGPFPKLEAADDFLDFIKRNYRLRQCRVLKKRTSPCLYYHIGRCSAPCCGKITEEEYKKEMEEILLLLDGDTADSVARLQNVMKEAAAKLQFERAARIRDGIRAIHELREQNAVVDMDPESRDYIAWAAEGTMVTFAVLQMRSGKLTGRELYRVRSLKDEEEILPEFLMAYYTDAAMVPPRIFVPTASGLALAEKWFAKELGTATDIEVIELPGSASVDADGTTDATREVSLGASIHADAPGEVSLGASDHATREVSLGASVDASVEADAFHEVSGGDPTLRRHTAAMAMASFNARQDAERRLREHGDFPALEELKAVLGLPTLPSRIEGFDIAHIGGRLPVASLISFHDGNPDRKNYRMFRLRTTDGIIDDFASMREVTSRRYTRLINEGAEMPDLILIDGGIGQVNAVQGVLDSLKLDIPIAGLAKQDEEIYRPGNSKPISLPRRSDALRLLQRVRDETHRFATTRNQKLRTKENTTLVFENLSGIGPKKAVAILERFGSLERLAEAALAPEGIAAIAEAASISKKAATALAASLPELIAQREMDRKKRAAGTDGIGTQSGMPGSENHAAEIKHLAELAAAENIPLYEENTNKGLPLP